ncbi:MAG TPA: Sua5 family C-terminal domain-containing protein, partial [Chthoniobacterales bacterium]|nr:Sua5 family C-terminal domain-containing protein [Chthoniobacterales bacterium]
EAPGQLASHYAPRTPLVLTNEIASVALHRQRVGALSWSRAGLVGFAAERTLSASADLREAAANLFRYLRELDEAGLDLIVAQQVPDTGLGVAINDRLRRAAAKNDGGVSSGARGTPERSL